MTEIQRVLAPNPGRFTGPGTNTYVIADQDQCLIVDPGPIEDSHRAAIEAAVTGVDVRGVLVTHTHPDHAPLANPLAAAFDVPAYGHAPGPEFDPDRRLSDGDAVPVGRTAARVVYTPGHAGDHLCFAIDDVLFTGDHIMGGSTVVIEDLAAYLDSLRKLQREVWTRLYPGHGPEIDDPQRVIQDYIDHRLVRERQILEAIRAGASTVGGIVQVVYTDVDVDLHPIAAYSVAAHLVKLAGERVVSFRSVEEGLWDEPVVLAGEATG